MVILGDFVLEDEILFFWSTIVRVLLGRNPVLGDGIFVTAGLRYWLGFGQREGFGELVVAVCLDFQIPILNMPSSLEALRQLSEVDALRGLLFKSDFWKSAVLPRIRNPPLLLGACRGLEVCLMCRLARLC